MFLFSFFLILACIFYYIFSMQSFLLWSNSINPEKYLKNFICAASKRWMSLLFSVHIAVSYISAVALWYDMLCIVYFRELLFFA
jgi:hypothetical protein